MTWIPIPEDSDFSIHNLPFGIYSSTGPRRPGVAIGDLVLNLAGAAELGLFEDVGLDASTLAQPNLNAFIRQGKAVTNQVRQHLQAALKDEDSSLREASQLFERQVDVKLHMPVEVGDYTDFYSSIEHATNVGKMFRDPENALLPNWRHLPVGYHGRASSIVVSGTPVRRPRGQVMPKDAAAPVYRASGRLDFELEMAFVIGQDSNLGSPISTGDADAYIFGLLLFNDWSARDIQKWEYVPLGPFLGKNFVSSVSPWIVPLEALDPFRVDGPVQEPAVLPYLAYDGAKNYDINLEVGLKPKGGEEAVIAKSNFKYMYWNMAQQLAHHTVNGCNVRVGDLLASGTISGKSEQSYGSMLELAWAGSRPLTLADGSKRAFIEDYDTVTMRGFAERGGIRVGFGEVKSQVLPA